MNMNMKNNKKGQVVVGVIAWLFATFFYFMAGYPIFRGIMDSIIGSGDFTGISLFFATVAPFVPIMGLVWWGYKIMNPEPSFDGGGLSQ